MASSNCIAMYVPGSRRRIGLGPLGRISSENRCANGMDLFWQTYESWKPEVGSMTLILVEYTESPELSCRPPSRPFGLTYAVHLHAFYRAEVSPREVMDSVVFNRCKDVIEPSMWNTLTCPFARRLSNVLAPILSHRRNPANYASRSLSAQGREAIQALIFSSSHPTDRGPSFFAFGNLPSDIHRYIVLRLTPVASSTCAHLSKRAIFPPHK